jgi:hypothetical protein
VTAVLTPPYAPPEQYSTRGRQGPWTDVYAVGATLYGLLTGTLPPEAPERKDAERDPLVPPDRVPGAEVSLEVAAVVVRAMTLDVPPEPGEPAATPRKGAPPARYRDAAELQSALDVAAKAAAARRAAEAERRSERERRAAEATRRKAERRRRQVDARQGQSWRRRLLGMLVGVAVLVVLGLALFWLAQPGVVVLSSHPSGASVETAETGIYLGKTPLRLEDAAALQGRSVRLHADGWWPVTAVLPEAGGWGTDAAAFVRLQPPPHVRFECDTEAVAVSRGSQLLGRTPFEWVLPSELAEDAAAAIELDAQKDGFRRAALSLPIEDLRAGRTVAVPPLVPLPRAAVTSDPAGCRVVWRDGNEAREIGTTPFEWAVPEGLLGTDARGKGPSVRVRLEATREGYRGDSVDIEATELERGGPVAFQLDDHGDDAATATEVLPGVAREGRIAPGSDVDVFRMAVGYPAWLTVATAGDLDTECALRAADGEEVAADDESGDGGNCRIEQLVDAGTWYAEVRMNGQRLRRGLDPGGGDYRLRLDLDDHHDRPDEATAVTPGEERSATLERGGDVDVFVVVTAVTSGRVRVETTGALDTRCRILSRAGTVRATADDGGTGGNCRVEAAIAPGPVFVAVDASRGDVTGPYGVRVDLDDHGDTAGEATPLSQDSAMQGAFERAGDADVFRLTLPEAGTLRAGTTGTRDTVCELLDASGAVVASDDDGGPDRNCLVVAPVAAGDAFLRVREYVLAGGADTYEVRAIVDDHGDGRDEATAIALGEWKDGRIERIGDVDLFRFELPAAGTVRVETQGPTDTHCHILQNVSEEEVAQDDDGGDSRNCECRRSLGAGTWLFKVRHHAAKGTGAYRVSVRVDDHGDRPDTATALTVGTPQAGRIDSADDTDCFRVEVPVGGVLRIGTTGPSDAMCRVHDAGGREVAADDDGGDERNCRIAYRPAAGGSHYVTVRRGGSGSPGGDYELRADVDDHGDDAATATPLAVGRPAEGRIQRADDVDVFLVHASRSGRLRAGTSGATDTACELRDDKGTLLASGDDRGSDLNCRLAGRVSRGRAYTVWVRRYGGAEGAYVLRTALETDNSF